MNICSRHKSQLHFQGKKCWQGKGKIGQYDPLFAYVILRYLRIVIIEMSFAFTGITKGKSGDWRDPGDTVVMR